MNIIINNEKEIEKYKRTITELGNNKYQSSTFDVEIDMCLEDITAKNIYNRLVESWTEEYKEILKKNCKYLLNEYSYLECDVKDITINNMQPQAYPNDCLFKLNITAEFIYKIIIKDKNNLNKELQ